MPLLPKNFAWSDKLLKSTFKGKPNILAASDINRYMDSIKEFQVRNGNSVGGIRENFNIEYDGVDSRNGVLADTHYYKYKIVKVNPSLEHGLYFNGVRYDIPINSAWVEESVTKLVVTSPISLLLTEQYICLVATKKAIDFNSPTTMHVTDPKKFCGVSGDVLPTDLPSSDAVIWGAERIVVTQDPTTISLGTDEYLVCIIATLRDKKIHTQSFTIGEVDTTDAPILMYNCISLTEMSNKLGYVVNNAFISGHGVYSKHYKTNDSFADFISLFWEEYQSGQAYQDNLLKLTVDTNISNYDSINGINNNLTVFFAAYDSWKLSVETRFSQIIPVDTWHVIGNIADPISGDFYNGTSKFTLPATLDYLDESATSQSFDLSDVQLQFRKIGAKIVEITGLFLLGSTIPASSGANYVVAVLPLGYRPAKAVIVTSETSLVSGEQAKVRILPNGRIIVGLCPSTANTLDISAVFYTE